MILAEIARDHIVDPVDRLAPALMALSVSKSTGLLHLSGEIRNKIYSYLLADRPSLSKAMRLAFACRQTRTEYLSLCFKKDGMSLEHHELIPFLQTFFGAKAEESGISRPHKCKLHVWLLWGRNYEPLDIQWLAAFLRAHPRVGVTFINHNSESKDTNVLFGAIRSSSVWHDHRDDFASVTLKTLERSRDEARGQVARRGGRRGRRGEHTRRDRSSGPWCLCIVLKKSFADTWWDEETRRERVSNLLSPLGPTRGHGVSDACSRFLAVEIKVSKEDSEEIVQYSTSQIR